MPQSNIRPIVGIDLGTTNSAVSRIKQGKAEIIELNEQGDRILPSVVLMDQNGQVVVGQDARSALVAMPERTAAEVKRKMGSQDEISLAGTELLPEEISSFILEELKKSVDGIYGPEIEKEAVITVPAYFTDDQRKATRRAGELAGFIVERIINEPTAAAMAYGLDNISEESKILVYDLGGGTFDVSVVEMMEGILEVKASHGNKNLGGTDFDQKLLDFFAEKVIEKCGQDPRDDLRSAALLKEKAEECKISLSEQKEVELSIPSVIVVDNKPVSLDLTISRKQFEGMIADKLAETINSIEKVLQDAELTKKEIDQILLVGGSTRIPRVQQLVADFFGKEPRNDINPEETVALGAAVQAGLKSGSLADSGLIVTDVAPYSLGVETLQEWHGRRMKPGGFTAIIPRNTTIPTTRTEEFSTVFDNQTKVSINIYQGEGEWVRENHKLGEFLLEGIPARRAGQEKIAVTFSYDLNGILQVEAECVSTNKKMQVVVEDALDRDSEESFVESREKLEDFLEEAAREASEKEEELDEFDEYMEQAMEEEMEKDFIDEETEAKLEDRLAEEIKLLRERLKEIKEEYQDIPAQKIEQILDKISKTASLDDPQKQEVLLEELTDSLFDLEMEIDEEGDDFNG